MSTALTASNAQQISSVPRGKSLTAFAEERARFLGRRPLCTLCTVDYVDCVNCVDCRARHGFLIFRLHEKQGVQTAHVESVKIIRIPWPATLINISVIRQMLSCISRLPNVLQLAFDKCCRAPVAFRTHSDRCKARVFTTSACLKHSRDGKACVFTTSAWLKHSRDGKACKSLCADHKRKLKSQFSVQFETQALCG